MKEEINGSRKEIKKEKIKETMNFQFSQEAENFLII
jgi:hypothetical protein